MSTTVVGANILKDGVDPKIRPDSEYPDWLWHLINKRPALSELRRKNTETLPYENLKRFVNLDKWTTDQGSRKTTPLRPRTELKSVCLSSLINFHLLGFFWVIDLHVWK